ncbi:homeobox protein Hox-C9-like [Ptychodera flava]|uniref:homeobox protein Hox-C9-like n=1 Tax=Ptychodera flava TaxID=63121 RepID=UPI00396A0B9D
MLATENAPFLNSSKMQLQGSSEWCGGMKSSMDRLSALFREKQNSAPDGGYPNMTTDQNIYPCRYPQYYNNMDPANSAYSEAMPTWNSLDLNQTRQCLNGFQPTSMYGGGGSIAQHHPYANTNYGVHPSAYTGNVPGVTDMSNCNWLSTFTTTPRRTKRRPYSKMQIYELEKAFQQNAYLTRERRQKYSQQLSLTERQVKIWFQNRRMKSKKQVEREKMEEKERQAHEQSLV